MIDYNSWNFSWNTFTIEIENNGDNQGLIIKQETINRGEGIQVQFMAYRSNKRKKEIEVDGVTINSEVTNIISGQGT